MNHDHIRIIDTLAGKLDRKGLTRLRRIARSWFKKAPVIPFPKKPASILIVKLWGIGSMVLASRAIQSLREGFPEATIHLITSNECAPIYEQARIYDKTTILDLTDVSHLRRHLKQLSRTLQQDAPEVAINLDGLSNLSSLIVHQCGAPVTVGFEREEENQFEYTHPLPYDPEKNISQMLYDEMRNLGGAIIDTPCVRPAVREQDRSFVADMLREMQPDPHTYMVGFNINAGGFAYERRWAGEKFALLAQAIEEHEEYVTVFFGTREEERYTLRHVKMMEPPAVSLAGALSLRQYMAWLERLHLVIANDSGTLQLAAALGVPTVGIYGPESPQRVRLSTHEKHAEIFHNLPCGPCVSLFEMKNNMCLDGCSCIRNITLDEVRSVVMDMLDHLSDPVDPPWITSPKKKAPTK